MIAPSDAKARPWLRRTVVAFGLVAAVITALVALVLLIAEVDLRTPEVWRALVAWFIGAVVTGALVRPPTRDEPPMRRFWAAIAVGVIVHPVAWLVFVFLVRALPIPGMDMSGSILLDISSAMGFSVGSLFYGAWLTIPAAFASQRLAARESQGA